MKTDLSKQSKSTGKQAKSVNKRFGLFSMWNETLPTIVDVERSARKLVNKIATKLPKKSNASIFHNEETAKTSNYIPKWPSSLPSWRNKNRHFENEAPTYEIKYGDLPEFLQTKQPTFTDLQSFPTVKAKQIILPQEQSSATTSSQMPQVLAELRKKLSFDFLNSKEAKHDTTKVLKKKQSQFDRLSEAELTELLKQITVIAFVGPSGTGKSTRASQVAFLSKCNYIIDDALLIKDNHIVAGSSAKRAKTKIESVRQAIFLDPIRAQTMKRALANHLPKRLLILGTSQSMINKICQALSLQAPQEWINIKDVATDSEIKQARYNRIHTGQHAIPVPSMELKHEFSGSIFEPLQLLKQRFSAKDIANGVKEIRHNLPSLSSYVMTNVDNNPVPVEQSIVRPSFSVLGHYSITDQALNNIVFYSLKKVPAVQKMRECKVRQETSGLVFNVNLALYYGYNAKEALEDAQRAIVDAVSRLTAMNILQVTLVADKLVQLPQTTQY